MKDKDITVMNVDDFIREKRRAKAKFIRWGKNGAKCLLKFVKADNVDYERGFLYLGIRHFIPK